MFTLDPVSLFILALPDADKPPFGSLSDFLSDTSFFFMSQNLYSCGFNHFISLLLTLSIWLMYDYLWDSKGFDCLNVVPSASGLGKPKSPQAISNKVKLFALPKLSVKVAVAA